MFAQLYTGLDGAKFKQFFLNLDGCNFAVPNLQFYRSDGGMGYEGDEEYDEVKRNLLLYKYFTSTVLHFEFKYAGVKYNHVFNFEKDFMNSDNINAWVIIDKNLKISCFDEFCDILANL